MTTTETATHLYIKVDNPKGLMQSYVGPYEIVERPSLSTIRVKIGTLKSGVATSFFPVLLVYKITCDCGETFS